jgi:regulation of enolase protein 1 (concanavalin A-like superfamily)
MNIGGEFEASVEIIGDYEIKYDQMGFDDPTR